MFTNKVTKELIKKNLISILGISNELKENDISIIERSVTIKLKVLDKSINYVEIVKMLQKQLVYELNQHTDSNDYKIDIILGG